jgi:hypothetical protein
MLSAGIEARIGSYCASFFRSRNTMATNGANDVLSDAQKIVNVWSENTTFSMGEVTAITFRDKMTAVTEADLAVEAERQKLTALINARDAEIAALNQLVTRARSGMRSMFGPDSTQYEQAGGTRKSERKPPMRKPKAATPA